MELLYSVEMCSIGEKSVSVGEKSVSVGEKSVSVGCVSISATLPPRLARSKLIGTARGEVLYDKATTISNPLTEVMHLSVVCNKWASGTLPEFTDPAAARMGGGGGGVVVTVYLG